jgi:hypothetical protein
MAVISQVVRADVVYHVTPLTQADTATGMADAVLVQISQNLFAAIADKRKGTFEAPQQVVALRLDGASAMTDLLNYREIPPMFPDLPSDADRLAGK